MHCRGDHWSSGNLGTKLHRQGRLFFCFLRKLHQLLRHWCAGGESPPLRCMTKLSKNGVIPSKRSASKNPHPAGERTGPSTRCARSGRQKKPEGLPHFSVILSERSESKNPYFLADCHGPDGPRNDREKLRLLGQTETPAVKTAGVFLMQLGWWGCYASLTWAAKRRKAALPSGVFL